MNNKKLIKKLMQFREFGVFVVLVGMCIILTIITPIFIKPTNLLNIVRQTTEISIMAIGMTFIIVNAEIDLSVGSMYGFCAMLAAVMIRDGYSPTLAFLAALISGIIFGVINGFLSTKGRVPSFIVTLGTMQILRSAAFGISNGLNVSNFPESSLDSWVFVIGEQIGGIPIQVIIMVVLVIIAIIVMSKTSFGFKVYATGGNKNAARLAGIDTDLIKIISFVIMGAVSALAGMISLAYLHSVPTTAGQGREMDVIAAVILGGTNLAGGKGTIVGTLIGSIIMGVVRNGMVLIGVPAFYQTGFIGLVILLAVLADTWIGRKAG
ncbi:MAG TPA: ABC transporter permease [Clostridiaceae bacterium]|nr:ABC transporter permease [Clostridiaceae bacterium]